MGKGALKMVDYGTGVRLASHTSCQIHKCSDFWESKSLIGVERIGARLPPLCGWSFSFALRSPAVPMWSGCPGRQSCGRAHGNLHRRHCLNHSITTPTSVPLAESEGRDPQEHWVTDLVLALWCGRSGILGKLFSVSELTFLAFKERIQSKELQLKGEVRNYHEMGKRARDTVESSLIGTGGWPTNRGIITIQRVSSRGKGSKSHNWDPQHSGPATGSLHLPTSCQKPLHNTGPGSQSAASHIYQSTHSSQPTRRVGTLQPTEGSHSSGDESGETCETPSTEGHFSKAWTCPNLQKQGFPGGAVVKDSFPNAGDAEHPGLIPGLGSSPEGESGDTFQFSSLQNPTDREAWRATVHGVARVRHNWVTEHTHTLTHTHKHTSYIYI